MHDFKSGKRAKWVLLLNNRNKRSHNTGDLLLQVFINSKSELEKGSHKRPYVTYFPFFNCNYLGKSNFKARRHSAGQHVNGASAGQKDSKLSEVKLAKKVVASSWISVIKFSPHCDTKFWLYVQKSLAICLKSSEKLISVAA
jgi:hypothetical protein